MPLSDALILCPLLQTGKATPQTDARRLLQLASWCERYSPLSNIHDENSLWIDVTGTAHLFGGEKALLATIREDFNNLGYTAQPALAGSFGAAFALSHFAFDSNNIENRLAICIIPPGQLRRSLSSLPSKALRLSPQTLSLLQQLGLSTIGQLMDLPRETLKRRFPSEEQAKAVLLRLDQISGLRDEPLVPLSRPSVFSSRLRFAEALTSRQMLMQALIRLISSITQQLEEQKQGARKLTFTLWRLDGSTAHIQIGTSSPCRDRSHICKLFEEKLSHIEPGFGIDTLALIVDKSDPLSAIQSTLENRTKTHAASDPSALIDRLGNRLGEQKIGYLHALKSHIPERAQKLVKTPSPKNTWPENVETEKASPLASHNKSRNLTSTSPDRPFLLLDPPEPIEVMAPLPDEPPLLFIWRRVKRTVMNSNGPERITREWWLELDKKPGCPRDYYKVRTTEGSTFWLYRDGLYEGDEKSTSPPQWYMHGFFG